MLKGRRIVVLFIMIILIIAGCSQKEESDVQSLLSDKQSSGELSIQSESTVPQTDNQQTEHQVNSHQRVVYTKLQSWNGTKDYYEIAFNLPLSEAISSADFPKYLELSPRTKGTFEKIEDKIVRFYPTERFLGDTNYKIKIDQAVLLAGEYPKLELSFYNASPIIDLGQVSLLPGSKVNEYSLEFVIDHFRGRYLDSDYKEGIIVKLGSKKINIAKIKYDNSGEMLLETAPFTASEDQVFVISTNEKTFKNKNNILPYYANSIKEMRKFVFQQISTVTDKEGNARIEVTFSKNLDNEQSLTGLITVKDHQELAVSSSKFMNKVILTGNFKLNKDYTVELKAGIKAADNSVMAETKEETIHTYNRDRSIEFADKGIFISSLNNNAVNLKVVNYPEFEYQLWAVQVENIAEMIHNLNLFAYANTSPQDYYRNENLHWYGQQIKSGTVTSGVLTDKDCFIKLDLGKVASSDPNKIYILNLTGKVDKDDKLQIPRNYNYYYSDIQVSKMLLFTDLAVSAKAFKDKVLVNVVDVLDGSPIKRATVELRANNNVLLASGTTNRKGELTLDKLTKALDSDQFFIVAKRKGSIGFLASEAMYLDNTKFKVERDYSQDEYKLEAFSDRDSYRPGETVNLLVMLRDRDNKLVKEDLPLIVTVYDPRNSKISAEKITNYTAGFANYKFLTQANSNTGSWRFEVEFGNQKQFVEFTIETFVPERINLTVKTDKESYNYKDKNLNLTLKSNYLFGNPLVGANCNINIEFNHDYNFGQKNFSEYSFMDELATVDYSIFTQGQEFVSDENGLIQSSFKLLTKKESNHPYLVNLNTKLTEEGGRPIERNSILPVSPLKEYIGLSNNRYLNPQAGSYKVPVVLVDDSGQSLAKGSKVDFVIYGKRGSWWWDYDYNYRASYKKSESTAVISQGTVTIGKDKYITFTPQTSDFHLFIVEAKIQGTADYEINHKYFNSYWGDNSEITEDNSLELKADKDEYQVGETVKVSIPGSKDSKIYLTVVKKDKVLKQEIIEIKNNKDYIYEFSTDATMTPNVFVDVRVVQGQKDRKNDLPLRLYGIIPIKIIDKASKLEIKLEVPDRISSDSKLTGKIDVGVKKKTQYIVSIVDQGLINRTNYSIPNPWNLFYGNEGYFAQDYDNYSYFVNAQNLEIMRTIMIGGGRDFLQMYDEESLNGSAAKELNRLQETGVQRFKPVSYFLGILETDSKGKGEFSVNVADYIGALKVTVIAVNEQAFGQAIEHVIVKDDIIALPTFPRVLSPNDVFEIPVSVVIDPKISSNVEIELVTKGLVEITSKSKQVIPQGESRALLIFPAKVKDNIGKAEFTLRIVSKEFVSQKKVEVGIRLPSAYQTESQILSFTGEEITFSIPELGYGNSSKAYLSFTQGFEFDADQHLRNSISYPYGGAVMKTATTFVQLLLGDFIKDVNLRKELDANINAYFQTIVKYNKQGLWQWEGDWQEDENRKILNAYALHTCLIAKQKGYNINDFVYSEILSFLMKAHKNNSSIKFEDAYQLFVLALAGKPNIAVLNYYNEQKSITVESTAKTMLEMAYRESGFDIKDLTKDLKAKVTIQINDKSFNNLEPNEDVALALELYYNSTYNNRDEKQKAVNRATALALAKKMQIPSYWNHYDKGWNLFALAAFVSTLPKDYQNYKTAELEVTVAGKTTKLKVTDSFIMDLSAHKKKEVKIKALTPNAKGVTITVNNVFVPKLEDTKSTSNKLSVIVIYTDLNGNTLDVSSLKQGETFIAEIRTIPQLENTEFATTFILPSGWEFSSQKDDFNDYDRNNMTGRPNYIDSRDDRIIMYGKKEMYPSIIHKCKIHTVTKGKFMMPATISEDIYHPEIQGIIKGKVVEVK